MILCSGLFKLWTTITNKHGAKKNMTTKTEIHYDTTDIANSEHHDRSRNPNQLDLLIEIFCDIRDQLTLLTSSLDFFTSDILIKF